MFIAKWPKESRNMKKQIILFAALAFSIGSISAQKTTLSIGFEAGEPLHGFNDNYNGNPAGLGVNIFSKSGKLPLFWGFDFGYGSMGSNVYDIALDDQDLDVDEAQLRIRSNIYSYHIGLRLSPFKGLFRPYVEGMTGFRTFSTKTKITVDGLDSPYSTQNNSHDVAFSYGLSAGFMLGLGKSLYLEARLERLWGGKVEYVLQESMQIDDNDELSYETGSSNADMVNIQLGIGFRF